MKKTKTLLFIILFLLIILLVLLLLPVFKDDILLDRYTILKEGECGEYLGVNYVSEGLIDRAVVVLKKGDAFDVLFSLDKKGIKGKGETIASWNKKSFSFKIEEKEKDWIFTVDEKVAFLWHSSSCDFEVYFIDNFFCK